jgi:hypothetical protein
MADALLQKKGRPLPLAYIAQCGHKVDPDNPFWN